MKKENEKNTSYSSTGSFFLIFVATITYISVERLFSIDIFIAGPIGLGMAFVVDYFRSDRYVSVRGKNLAWVIHLKAILRIFLLMSLLVFSLYFAEYLWDISRR